LKSNSPIKQLSKSGKKPPTKPTDFAAATDLGHSDTVLVKY